MPAVVSSEPAGHPPARSDLAPALVNVMGMMMPSNMMMGEAEARAALGGAGFIGAWFAGHLLYGLVWGTTTGFGAARKTTSARGAAADLGMPR